PPAARIVSVAVTPAEPRGARDFEIRGSELRARPVARISPDLPVCANCLREMFDAADPRHGYPYINCTDCGPRYSIVLDLPYDRANTTMKDWRMDGYCGMQYGDPADRRFHAQPVACARCGPHYALETAAGRVDGDHAAVRRAAELLTAGGIVAVKGLGGYHLACNARNAAAVRLLRERKYRKEKPFAVMARDRECARGLVDLDAAAEEMLLSSARPIVLAPARVKLEAVAPESGELGVMLPYIFLHHLLFAAGAPDALVMTSGNRSSEPIAYRDDEARSTLDGIADAFLIGERPIARRVDDSVARVGAFGPAILRRSRGFAPGVVATLPAGPSILALGADLKNVIAVTVDGQTILSQYIGDLEYFPALEAFRETVRDLLRMYGLRSEEMLVVHDAHPEYWSTREALALPAARRIAVQHHRAHVASVLAEREEWDRPVLGVSFDGTGYGDDGAIWGGEFFAGSVAGGLRRVAHLRQAALAGGDAAARFPVQAAAGFLAQLDSVPPLDFPPRYREATQLLRTGFRTFQTSSVGRLFDTVAALAGFTREITFEGQAAMWLEHQARQSPPRSAYPFPFDGAELDFRPALATAVDDRAQGRDAPSIARAFHRGLAEGVAQACRTLCRKHALNAIVLSGGVFQNELLLEDLRDLLDGAPAVWTNHAVPANDGGIALGQAALAAFAETRDA
ncbi:MAG TPA: carbamoyltransferase HypF, partial [Bryobacteraceae bacterium]